MSQEKTTDDCSRHEMNVAGLTPEQLSKEIVNMHYKGLAELFNHLPDDFAKAAEKDNADGKEDLAFALTTISAVLRRDNIFFNDPWRLSKPFMEK